MEKIIVELETRHFKKSWGYTARYACPLYKALLEMYPHLTSRTQIILNVDTAYIDGVRYTIEGADKGDENNVIAFNGLSGKEVDAMIIRAHEGQEIETVTVTLIPVE